MHWKLPNNFTSDQDQQTPSNVQDIPSQFRYSSCAVNSSPSSSHSPTASSFSSSSMHVRDRAPCPSLAQPSPVEAADIIASLKEKSIDDLRKLLHDADLYEPFFQSLDLIKTQNHVRHELQKETLQLARNNIEKEQHILELENQCNIIRSTELSAAQEKYLELERRKDELLRFYSPASLLQKLHDALEKTDEESEELNRQLLAGDIDMTTFLQDYKNLRALYHKRSLVHSAAKTSV